MRGRGGHFCECLPIPGRKEKQKRRQIKQFPACHPFALQSRKVPGGKSSNFFENGAEHGIAIWVETTAYFGFFPALRTCFSFLFFRGMKRGFPLFSFLSCREDNVDCGDGSKERRERERERERMQAAFREYPHPIFPKEKNRKYGGVLYSGKGRTCAHVFFSFRIASQTALAAS